MSLISEYVEME